jgi:HAE1 family hydrophobic/amphiphilic exporter-1
MASRFLPEQVGKDGKIGAALERFFKYLEKLYARSVRFLIKSKRRSASVIALTFAAFVLSIFGFGFVEMELIPKSDGGKIHIDVELPQGSSLDMTADVLAQIEGKIARYDEVQTILTSLGNMGSISRDVSVARMEVSLIPKKQRAQNNSVLAARMTRTISDIPGADIRVVAPSEFTIAQGAAVDLMIQGSDIGTLQKLGDELKNRVRTVPGIMNLAVNTSAGKDELIFEPNRKQISQDGITVQSVAVSLRAAIDGMVSTVYHEGGEEYDMRVKMKDSAIRDIEDIRNIPIVSAKGIFPLSRYADIHFESGYNMILRVDKIRTLELTAYLLPGYAQGTVMADVLRLAGEIDLPEGYSIRQAGISESMDDSNMGLAIVFISAILLVYMLLAAILENLVQPLFILSTIPLSIIGVVAGCLLTGTILNSIAMIGIVMLVGIVVNNAILLLDYYNQLKQEGLSVPEALIKACPAKLKAILMSNIAIILGMIPMALGIGESLAEMRQPMGIIVTGGIISSTVMTLWLIPCLEFAFTRWTAKHQTTNKGNSK